jgi:hypothetical protein
MTLCVSIKCHLAECNYADCRYAECRYAECRGAILVRASDGQGLHIPFSINFLAVGETVNRTNAAELNN